jgi:hypothetical protein
MNRWLFLLPPAASIPAALILAALILVPSLPLAAQQPETATQLTIYNQDFAVARTTVPLDLHAGTNEVLTTNVTSQLEPDSVVLRDATGHRALRVSEQNYDAGVVTQPWLLEKYEGKTIDFQTTGPQVVDTATGERKTLSATIVKGKIVRAGNDPLIEVDGHLQFQLPGLPIFPATTDGLLLKPTLRWQIDAGKPEKFDAELDYITHGMSWQATYNIVVPEEKKTAEPDKNEATASELADVTGWVTIQNNSGTDFPKVTIQLMAGDVAKIQDLQPRAMGRAYAMVMDAAAVAPEVTQKEFDDFHLYDLHRTLALRNGESKQVQFLEASNVTVQRTYQFDGNEPVMLNFYAGYHNDQRAFGNSSNTKVAIREEIKNSEANHLGMPLPAGRLRLYRQETGGQMQFVGESMVSHTPADQSVQVTSGNAFDLTAERRQTNFHVDTNGHVIDETFEIKLSNAKSTPVTIHDIEHMNRSQNWEITQKSADFKKLDSATLDFPVTVPARGETTLTYSVRYTW